MDRVSRPSSPPPLIDPPPISGPDIEVIEPAREPRAYSRQLTRDDRRRIRTLRFDAGWTYQRIASHTGYTSARFSIPATSR